MRRLGPSARLLGPIALLALSVRLARAADAAGSPEADPLVALRADLAAQRAALEALQAREADRIAAKEAPEGPLIRVSGYVQLDWVLHDQRSVNEVDPSTGAPLNDDRFTLRRSRLRVDASRGLLAARLEIDANTVNGVQVRPLDAEVSVGWPPREAPANPAGGAVRLVLGLTRIPFGFEVRERDDLRPFLERGSVFRALFPGEFDLGLRLEGDYRGVEGALALMNGSPVGARVFPALAPTRTKELVGRLGAHAKVAPRVRVEAGISGDTGLGFHQGTPSTKDALAWHDDNGDGLVQATEIGVISGVSATASQTFARFAVGGDARLLIDLPWLGEMTLRAEIVRAQNLDRGLEPADPVGAGYALRELGFALGLTTEITRWGMIGVRYDRYDPDQDARETRPLAVVPADRTYSTWALTGMLRYETARLVIEYDKNGNALGRDASGAPATLEADAVTLRGQVAF